MSDGLIVQISKTPLWDRSLALHEASHAVAAWLNGAGHIQISLADEFRIAKLRNGEEVDDCRAVCAHNLPSRGRNHLASMVVSFAGVMAQHQYTGEEPGELLKKGGKGDASDIAQSLENYRNEGATEEDCARLYDRAYSLSLKLVTRYWWEIIALAKMTEHYSYVSPAKISCLMNSFISMQHPVRAMEELES